MSPPCICETLHCRGSRLLVASPDKSLRGLMFVSDRGWLHNCLEARRHGIHVTAIASSNIVRVMPLPHTCSMKPKHISQSSHAIPLFLPQYHALEKWFQGPKFNTDRMCSVKWPTAVRYWSEF